MKRDKRLIWSHANAASPGLKGMRVSIVGGTGGTGRALSRFLASRGASVLAMGRTLRNMESLVRLLTRTADA